MQVPFVRRKHYDEMVYKLECLLCHATGGRYSKAGYRLEDMYVMVDDYINELVDEEIEANVKRETEEISKR